MLFRSDSALVGTKMRMAPRNLGVRHVIVAGIFTDQCISSSVRSLANEDFGVVVGEDCSAAATRELHEAELRIINMIYSHVASGGDVRSFVP